MELQEIKTLIKDIILITQSNQIRWNPTDTEGEYGVVLGLGTITIDRAYEPSDDNYNYYFIIRNSNGDVIFNWSTEPNNRIDESILINLYESAENSSLQRDVTFDSIKTTIKNIMDAPF